MTQTPFPMSATDYRTSDVLNEFGRAVHDIARHFTDLGADEDQALTDAADAMVLRMIEDRPDLAFALADAVDRYR